MTQGEAREHGHCCGAVESVSEYTLVSKDTVEMATTVSTDNQSNQTNRSLNLSRQIHCLFGQFFYLPNL